MRLEARELDVGKALPASADVLDLLTRNSHAKTEQRGILGASAITSDLSSN